MKKVSESRVEESTTHQLVYYRQGTLGGFGFECDEGGEVYEERLAEAALENLRKCREGEHDVLPPEIATHHHRYKWPAVWVCCETEFECDRFTNTCPDCGADYNSAGQLLAPREQWGEETGEHPADIARIP